MDDWKDSDSANYILKEAETKYLNATVTSAKAEAEEVGRIAQEKFWKELNPDDGFAGFSQNPYTRDKERNLKTIERTADNAMVLGKILKFVRDRICNLIDEKNGV